MKLKLPTHFHLPHFRVERRKVGRFMMKYGAYAMVFDGTVKLLYLAFGLTALHAAHEVAGVFGSNGAAFAGIGALLDMADDA